MGTQRTRKTVGKRARRMARRPAPNVAEFNGDRYITKADAVAFLASRVKENDEEERDPRDRCRKLIADHIRRGLLATNAGRLQVAELGRWARERWPGRFDDMPARGVGRIGSARGYGRSGEVYGIGLSANLADCHQEIIRLVERERELKARVRELETTIAQLSPDAQRYRENKVKNQENARKPRRR